MNWCEEYEYRDGNLFAKTSINGKYPVGRKVGYVDVRGYVRTKLGSKMTFAHRIIWEMHFGPVPKGLELDHINGDKADNRIENLRLVNRYLNCKNAKMRADNKSGVTGVCVKKNGSFVVQIQANNERISRTFRDRVEAEKYARKVYESIPEFTERHGK